MDAHHLLRAGKFHPEDKARQNIPRGVRNCRGNYFVQIICVTAIYHEGVSNSIRPGKNAGRTMQRDRTSSFAGMNPSIDSQDLETSSDSKRKF